MTATDLMNEPIHPTRVLPTEADVADAIEKSDWPTDGRATRLDHPNAYLRRARAVLALFAGQPTVARVKADVWDESSKATSEAIFSSRDARGVCISWVIPTNPYRESEG